MDKHVFAIGLLLAALLVAAMPAAAAAPTEVDPFPATARSADEFRDRADALRLDLQSGGKHGAMSAQDRAAVEADLSRLQQLYDKHAQGRQVDDNLPMKIAAINAYSRINATLAGSADDRMICEQVKKVGSNRYGKYCATVRERRENRLAAQKAHLDWFMPKPDNERITR